MLGMPHGWRVTLPTLALTIGAVFVMCGNTSSCDLYVWYDAGGLQYGCPSGPCALGGTPPTHTVTGSCQSEFGTYMGYPQFSCACEDGEKGSTRDACATHVIVVGAGLEPTCEPVSCPGIGFPQPTCKDMSSGFPTVPTQICQCHGGEEEWDN